MNNYWKTIGIAAVASGIMYYPIMRLVKYFLGPANPKEEEEQQKTVHYVRAFVPAYRGKHKPHHRHGGDGHNNENS